MEERLETGTGPDPTLPSVDNYPLTECAERPNGSIDAVIAVGGGKEVPSRSRFADADRIVVDLNTQCDFLSPRGALPVLNRAEILPNMRRLMAWAQAQHVPVISSMDAHRPNEPLNGTAPHCIDDTVGQRKLPFTLLSRHLFLTADNTLDIPNDVLRLYRQVVLAKRTRDFLNNPKADRLVTEMNPHYFIVFGVVAEVCVKSVVLGLLARHRNVVLAADAIGYWNAAEAELARRQMEAKGAVMASTDDILTGRHFDFPQFAEPEPENLRIIPAPIHHASRGMRRLA